jgi:hypothetical protein
VVALPEPGQLRIGPVDLPPGKVLTSGLYGDGAPPREVAWVTLDPVPAAGRVWQQLSGLHHQTGLVPILLDTLDDQLRRPWDDEEFGDPVDLRAVDDVDAGDFLTDWWHGSLPDEDEVDYEEREMWEPFGFDSLRLLVERPPRTRELAEHLAAEQFQLANDCVDGERSIPRIAPRLLNSPYWTFWWD